MHKTLELAKILKKGSGSEKKSSMTVLLAIIGVLLAAIFVFMGMFLDNLKAVIGDPNTMILTLVLVGTILVIFLVVPMIINTMYMSNDLPLLLTLPYTYNQIIWAKVFNVSSIAWLASAVFTLPCGLAYGIAGGKSFSFFLALILAAICVPIITLSFAASIIILIMYFVHSLRNKDTLKIIGAVCGFVIMVGIILAINLNKADTSAVSRIVNTIGRFVDIIPVSFALKVLLNGSLDGLMVLAIVGITAGFFLLFVILTKFLYINGALSMQDTSSASMKLDGAAYEKVCRQKNLFKTYLSRDFKLVRRNPAYLMNGFLVPYIYPAVILLVYIFSSNSLGFLSISNLETNMDYLGWTTCIAMLVGSLAASGNVIATSCMSREGEDIMILKQIPVDFRVVLKAKQWTALLVSCGSGFLYIVIGGLVMISLGILPLWTLPYSILLNFATMFFCTGTVMIPDIKKPLFTWESEADMLKSRTTATGVILLIAGFLVPMVIAIALKCLSGEFFWPILAFMVVLSVFMIFITNKRLFKIGPEKMSRY